jgi:hypothetical protein
MEFNRKKEADGRRRLSPLLWLASLGAIGLMVLGITGTLSQYVASITNSENHVETGGADTFGFSESNVVGGIPDDPACAEASAGQAVTCSTVNKNGQTGATATPIAPGQVRTTTVRLENTASPGGLSGTLTLTPEPCTQTPAAGPGPPVVGDLCGTATIEITCSGPVPFHLTTRTLTAFSTNPTATPPGPPYVIATAAAPGSFTDCTFTTSMPALATDPSLQGITTSQPMTWTFTQV